MEFCLLDSVLVGAFRLGRIVIDRLTASPKYPHPLKLWSRTSQWQLPSFQNQPFCFANIRPPYSSPDSLDFLRCSINTTLKVSDQLCIFTCMLARKSTRWGDPLIQPLGKYLCSTSCLVSGLT